MKEELQNGQSREAVEAVGGLETTARHASSSEDVTGEARGRRDNASALQEDVMSKLDQWLAKLPKGP